MKRHIETGRGRATSSFLWMKKLQMRTILGLMMLFLLVMMGLWAAGREEPPLPGWNLVIRQAADGEMLFTAPVNRDDLLIFHWVHSVEHFRWEETIIITEEGRLKLLESRFEGYGAGIPYENPGGVRVADGWVILENMNLDLEQYDWLHSHTALPEITMNDETLLRGKDLPHHQSLRMTIEER